MENTIQQATLDDVAAICSLIDAHRFREDGSGALLPVRPEQVLGIILDEALGSFISAVNGEGELVGCVSVAVYGLPADHGRTLLELRRRLTQGNVKGHFSAVVPPGETEGAPAQIAELRSLAVQGAYRGSGLGLELIQAAKQEAQRRGFKELYSLVNDRAVALFERCGFRKAERPPHKLAVDCARCLILERCNEVPVVAEL